MKVQSLKVNKVIYFYLQLIAYKLVTSVLKAIKIFFFLFISGSQVIHKKVMAEKQKSKLDPEKINQIVLGNKGNTIISKNIILKQSSQDGNNVGEVNKRIYFKSIRN